MQRLNRSTHAPIGTAFLLFLGLAILPFSLRSAGVQVSFNPRLAAAMDAWQQIADVFGATYQPPSAPELSVVKDLDSEPSNAIDNSDSPRSSAFACTKRAEERAVTRLDAPKSRASKAATGRGVRPWSDSRSLAANRVSLVMAAGAIKASIEKLAPATIALGAMKLEALTSEQLAPSIETQVVWRSFPPTGEIRNLPVQKSMRVLVRLKRATAGFSAKPAESKVSAALASAQRHECNRAMLTNMPSTGPDNSEF
jgi:hypothetical protein